MVENDKKTGNDRSWGDFALGLADGGAAGAILYGTVMAAPVAGMAAGWDAQVMLGMAGVSAPVFTDKVFQNNVDMYENCGLILTLANSMYTEYGTTNMYRMPVGNSRQSLSNNQSVQKLKAQNSSSGTGGGNAGSGGGTLLNRTGVQIRNRQGKPVSTTEKTLDMALDPETYANAILKNMA